MGWLSRDPVEKVLGSGRSYVTDAETVDQASDYVPLIKAIAAVTGGMLDFERIECVEMGKIRTITLVQDDRPWMGVVDGDTDWIDSEKLVPLLNRVLSDTRAPGRIHAYSEKGWGQECGFLYALDGQLPALRAAGIIFEGDRPPDPVRPDDEVLAVNRMIHGHAIRAGAFVEYWHDEPFDEMSVTLGARQPLGGIVLPPKTQVLFNPEGELHCCIIPIAHETFVAGLRVPFVGGVWAFDEAELLPEYAT